MGFIILVELIARSQAKLRRKSKGREDGTIFRTRFMKLSRFKLKNRHNGRSGKFFREVQGQDHGMPSMQTPAGAILSLRRFLARK